MYPFYILGLPHEATDLEVETRYLELLRIYPPDRNPELFSVVRKAYEALKTPSSRLRVRLFSLDTSGEALHEPHPVLPPPTQRPSPSQLAQLLYPKEEP